MPRFLVVFYFIDVIFDSASGRTIKIEIDKLRNDRRAAGVDGHMGRYSPVCERRNIMTCVCKTGSWMLMIRVARRHRRLERSVCHAIVRPSLSCLMSRGLGGAARWRVDISVPGSWSVGWLVELARAAIHAHANLCVVSAREPAAAADAAP